MSALLALAAKIFLGAMCVALVWVSGFVFGCAAGRQQERDAQLKRIADRQRRYRQQGRAMKCR